MQHQKEPKHLRRDKKMPDQTYNRRSDSPCSTVFTSLINGLFSGEFEDDLEPEEKSNKNTQS